MYREFDFSFFHELEKKLRAMVTKDIQELPDNEDETLFGYRGSRFWSLENRIRNYQTSRAQKNKFIKIIHNQIKFLLPSGAWERACTRFDWTVRDDRGW
jgi:hypothetical protein